MEVSFTLFTKPSFVWLTTLKIHLEFAEECGSMYYYLLIKLFLTVFYYHVCVLKLFFKIFMSIYFFLFFSLNIYSELPCMIFFFLNNKLRINHIIFLKLKRHRENISRDFVREFHQNFCPLIPGLSATFARTYILFNFFRTKHLCIFDENFLCNDYKLFVQHFC